MREEVRNKTPKKDMDNRSFLWHGCNSTIFSPYVGFKFVLHCLDTRDVKNANMTAAVTGDWHLQA